MSTQSGEAHIPSIAEVERIAAIEDPTRRNLQITQCYYELSTALAGRIGGGANWCTFATWASNQAGHTIRKEDLRRALARRLAEKPAIRRAVEDLYASARLLGIERKEHILPSTKFSALDLSPSIAIASDAVGRGNLKVFAEIGYEFARFLNICLGDSAADLDNIASFCAALRPGEPPEGQNYLRRAFTHYYQCMFEISPKTRTELLLLANIEVGYHEQTRLQPEIQEALDAALTSAATINRSVLANFFPTSRWFALARLYLQRLLGRPTAFDLALGALVAHARVEMHQAITRNMMTILLPGGVLLRLGQDLEVGFPPSLSQITYGELIELLQKIDPTPDSVLGSGAVDWSDLSERLHYIIDLFRSYQESPDLLESPFTPEQVAVLKAQ